MEPFQAEGRDVVFRAVNDGDHLAHADLGPTPDPPLPDSNYDWMEDIAFLARMGPTDMSSAWTASNPSHPYPAPSITYRPSPQTRPSGELAAKLRDRYPAMSEAIDAAA